MTNTPALLILPTSCVRIQPKRPNGYFAAPRDPDQVDRGLIRKTPPGVGIRNQFLRLDKQSNGSRVTGQDSDSDYAESSNAPR